MLWSSFSIAKRSAPATDVPARSGAYLTRNSLVTVAVLPLTVSNVVHWASLAAFLAGACSNLALSLDNALLQAGTNAAMQGRVNAIANLTKGLQALSLAAAGYTIHLLASHFGGIGYQPVQLTLALALLGGTAWLWPRLDRLS